MKKVLIFGCSSGIGEAIFHRLSPTFDIFSASRNCPTTLNPTNHYSLDLSRSLSHSCIEDVINTVNPDCLIYSSGSNIVKSIGSYSVEDINYLVNLNLVSAFHASNTFANLIKSENSNRQRSLIFLSSIWAVKGAPMRSLYGLTKGGIDSLVRHLGAELAPFNVYVNSIQPGFCNTPLTSKTSLDPIVQNHLSRIDHSSGPLIDTSEIADFVYYLLTSKNSFNSHSFLFDKGLIHAS